MSKRREIERHVDSLDEIREIMNAMKNIALMESNKLTRVLATQRRAVATIESATADCLSFHAPPPQADEGAQGIDIVIGSERGFCGDFNERLIDAWKGRAAAGEPALIAIGSKLGARLTEEPRVAARLEGAGVMEEVEGVLLQLMRTLGDWHAARRRSLPLRLTVFHHVPDEPEVRVTRLDPFRADRAGAHRRGSPPRLTLDPLVYLRRLADHYLFAALHEMFYGSLMAENRRRMQHMEHAVHRIEERTRELLVRRNMMRQEEITEEIEVIMLSAQAGG